MRRQSHQQKTPRLRRFLLRLREGRMSAQQIAQVDAEILQEVRKFRYRVKVARIVGELFFSESFNRKVSADQLGERVRALIDRGFLDVYGDHRSSDPGWIRFAEIRCRK
jgi:Protein of unknown function